MDLREIAFWRHEDDEARALLVDGVPEEEV
jgi:hypothetical protein